MKKIFMLFICLFITATPIVANAEEYDADYWEEDPEDVADGWYPSDEYFYDEYINFGKNHSSNSDITDGPIVTESVTVINTTTETIEIDSEEYYAKAAKKENYEVEEYENKIQAVMTEDTEVYDSFVDEKSSIGCILVGDTFDITGETNNGFYEINFEQDGEYLTGYIEQDEDSYVDCETYDDSWNETGRVDATCTEDGVITYVNSITGEEKEEVLEKTGHKASTSKIVKKATIFTEGEKVTKCENCGEVLTSEVVPCKIVDFWDSLMATFTH